MIRRFAVFYDKHLEDLRLSGCWPLALIQTVGGGAEPDIADLILFRMPLVPGLAPLQPAPDGKTGPSPQCWLV